MTMWSRPTLGRWWIKTRLGEGALPPDAVPAVPAGVTVASHPSSRVTPDSARRLNPFGVAGPWCDRLPHFQRDIEITPAGHLQSEYFVPRARAPEAIARLRAIGERIDALLWSTEIRSMTGDRLWLSPAYGDDRIALHFSWMREIEAVAAMTREIEAMLLPLGARPHWGKIMHAPAARLAPLYPQLSAFRDLVRRYDPTGKLRNAFLDRHVFA
jgi:alditol oxidase